MSSLSAKDRSRSPRFPSHPVSDAIEYVKRIYDGAHRSPIDAQTAFRLMGFSGKSGASATALGSMRQFGLIEGMGDNTRVSDLALKLLEPESHTERIEALVEASRKPEVFKMVLDRFGGRAPNADEPIRAFLIRELGFSKGGAEDCLASLRATMEFSGEAERGASSFIKENIQEIQAPPPADSERHNLPSGEVMRIPLTRDCIAELRLQGEITEKALTNLVRHIELMKEVWAEG